MKKTLYIITLILLTACGKSSISQDPIDPIPQVIKLSTQDLVVSKGAEGTTTVFAVDDKIGVFQANQDTPVSGPAVIGDLVTKNIGYSYGTPYWKPLNEESQLLYTENNSTKLFAYFPYSQFAAAEPVVKLTVDEAAATLDFTILQNQTTNSNTALNKTDLLYAKATGISEAGNVNDGKPINLAFNHKLTKFGYSIKVEDTRISDASTKTVYLRHVEITGNDIFTGLKLNLLDGTVVNEVGTTTVSWEAHDASKGILLQTFANGALGKPTEVYNFFLVPFLDQLENANKVVFYITDHNDALPSDKTFEEMIQDKLIVDYTWEIPAPEGIYVFGVGIYNKIDVVIDLAQRQLNVTATIQPWGNKGSNNDVEIH